MEPRREHPRVCGENISRSGLAGTTPGTPPRMRGKRSSKIRTAYGQGHPRVCGENARSATLRGGSRGTPPRMRGKHDERQESYLIHGDTPAYAGKTLHDQHVYRAKPSFSITSSDNPTLQQACRASQPGVGTSTLFYYGERDGMNLQVRGHISLEIHRERL